MGDHFTFQCVQIVALISKLDWLAPLITYAPAANSTTMHIRVVCQYRNLCLGEPAYLPCPAKLP